MKATFETTAFYEDTRIRKDYYLWAIGKLIKYSDSSRLSRTMYWIIQQHFRIMQRFWKA